MQPLRLLEISLIVAVPLFIVIVGILVCSRTTQHLKKRFIPLWLTIIHQHTFKFHVLCEEVTGHGLL